MWQLYNAGDLWVANSFCELTVPKCYLPNTAGLCEQSNNCKSHRVGITSKLQTFKVYNIDAPKVIKV